jgi:hypothetical protein
MTKRNPEEIELDMKAIIAIRKEDFDSLGLDVQEALPQIFEEQGPARLKKDYGVEVDPSSFRCRRVGNNLEFGFDLRRKKKERDPEKELLKKGYFKIRIY